MFPMKARKQGLALAVAVTLAWAQIPQVGAAEAKTQVPVGAISGKPDFSGFWRWKDFKPGVVRAGIIPFTPPYEERIVEVNRIAAAGGDVPTVSKRCLPFGMPFGMVFFKEILFAPTHAVMLYGGGARHIWLDGRQHTPDNKLFESLDGESIGHWEGDTLVISTRGVQENEITLGVPVPGMTIVERMRLTEPDNMQVTTTVTAPGALREPWTLVRNYGRSRTMLDAGNHTCDPSKDRSVDPETGKQRFDLTPPTGGFDPPDAGK